MSAIKKWNDKTPSVREWQDRTRAKIQASNVLAIALKAANGEVELSTSRATIIKTLLDRVLPAQTSADVTQHVETAPDLQAIKDLVEASPELQSLLAGMLKPIDRETPVLAIDLQGTKH